MGHISVFAEFSSVLTPGNVEREGWRIARNGSWFTIGPLDWKVPGFGPIVDWCSMASQWFTSGLLSGPMIADGLFLKAFFRVEYLKIGHFGERRPLHSKSS